MSVKMRFWPLVSTLLLLISSVSGLNIPRSLYLSLNLAPGFDPILGPGEGCVVDYRTIIWVARSECGCIAACPNARLFGYWFTAY